MLALFCHYGYDFLLDGRTIVHGGLGNVAVTPAADGGTVFFSCECSCCLIVFMPEEFLHLGGDDDFSSLVVYGSIRQVGVEGDGVVGCPAVDGSSQLSCVDEDMSSGSCWRLSSLPCLGEERLPFEVLVELVGEVNLNVAEYVFYYFLNIFRHFVWRLEIFLYLCNEDSVANDYRFLARMRNEQSFLRLFI